MPKGRPKGSKNSKAKVAVGTVSGAVMSSAMLVSAPEEQIVETISLDKERARALDIAIGHVEAEYGKGILYTEENMEVLKNRPVYSTGFPSLDHIISAKGGIPSGRVIEAYGHKSSGKSTFALHLSAEMNRIGLPVLYVDLENTLDLELAKRMGVQVGTNLFIVSTPAYGEQALDVLNKFARSKACGLIVLDSVSALCPKEEDEKGVEKVTMGSVARMMSKELRILTGIVSRPENNTLVLFINQIRKNLAAWGAPNTTSGGEALPFFASVRLEFRQTEILKASSDGEPYGIEVNIKTVKNKIHNPYKECRLNLHFGKGFDLVADLMKVAVDLGIMEKGGAWYQYGDQKLQGEDKMRAWLTEEATRLPALKQQIHQVVRG